MKEIIFNQRSNLKSVSNTEYIINNAYTRVWILRRLKALGASKHRLIDILQKPGLTLGWTAWLGLHDDTGRENRFELSTKKRFTHNMRG